MSTRQNNGNGLSRSAKKLIGQPMFALMAKASELEQTRRDVIHFEIGDPSFNSPESAKDAVKKALDANLTHYTNSMGIYEFREAICDYNKEYWGFRPSVDQVLVCPANAVIDFTLRCVADPGDEIIYPDPGFPTYNSAIVYNGYKPVGIKLKEKDYFRMNPEDVKRAITKKTRLIIINTPQNPTGSVMTKREVLEIADIAVKNGIYLLSDEVYSKIIFDNTHFSPSAVDLCKERVILLNSLSKIYSMSGWRLGYAIGPEQLIKKLGLLLQTIISCLPAFIQRGGMAAISGKQDIIRERLAELRERRDILVHGLNKLPGVTCVKPQGAFYVFPNIKKTGLSGDEFSEIMLEKVGVCVLPGNCFGKNGEDYVRLCYASTKTNVISEALGRMKTILS